MYYKRNEKFAIHLEITKKYSPPQKSKIVAPWVLCQTDEPGENLTLFSVVGKPVYNR